MKVLLVIVSFIALSWARKLPIIGDLAKESPDVFEDEILEVKNIKLFSAIPSPERRWPGGVIPYEIDRSLRLRRSLITKAMSHIMKKTSGCITFKERTNEKNYIHFVRNISCSSYVGMANIGGQNLSLSEECYNFGAILHELMHAIGFFHEHQRSDRDKYVTIYWKNIRPGADSQFEMLQPSENILYDSFDYNSITIYGEYAASKGRGLKTIEATKDGVRLKDAFEKLGLSDSDVYRIKKHYGCV